MGERRAAMGCVMGVMGGDLEPCRVLEAKGKDQLSYLHQQQLQSQLEPALMARLPWGVRGGPAAGESRVECPQSLAQRVLD